MYARSIEGMRRREKRVKRWFGVERGEEFFDRITVISVKLFCTSVLEFCSTKVESFVLIELSRSADFRFAVWQSAEENFRQE